jgi:hypothetical protein
LRKGKLLPMAVHGIDADAEIHPTGSAAEGGDVTIELSAQRLDLEALLNITGKTSGNGNLMVVAVALTHQIQLHNVAVTVQLSMKSPVAVTEIFCRKSALFFSVQYQEGVTAVAQ